MNALAWVLSALLLAGCNFEVPGQKAKDAGAMGYACRISKKSPEQCMRENPTFSQIAILDGWREGDLDVKDKKVDTNFSPPPPVVIPPPPAPPKKEGEEGEKKPEGEAPPEAKAAEPTQPPEPAKAP
ncbi:MAG: hypothetical protein WC091_13070 [Sulfuricellaceae bacterium]